MSLKCPYCGNNPVAGHFLHWYFESSNVFFTPLRQLLFNNPASRLIKKLSGKADLSLRLVRLGKFLGILKEQKDIQLCKVSRAKVLWEEAAKRNIQMSELLLFSKPFDCYIAWKNEFPISPPSPRLRGTGNFPARLRYDEVVAGGQFPINSQISNPKSKILNQKFVIVFSGLPRPKGYDDSALNWMDDKWLFKKKMIQFGLPVPQGESASSLSQAKKIFDVIQKSEIRNPKSETNLKSKILNPKFVIVKPRAGSRGRHSTIFVSSLQDLKKALKIAKQLCHWAIIEEQLKGPVYRATLINFELCGVLRGDPPEITGDGERTIKELISIKNALPHPGVKDIVVDEEMGRFLRRQISNFPARLRHDEVVAGGQFPISNQFLNSNFQFSDNPFAIIPVRGMIVSLSEKVGVNYGGSSSEDYEICHPDNKTLFISAAKIIGDPIVGFDFIIPDITKSWREQKCGFIEANSLPFINLHHDPLLGKPRNVAAKVWGMMAF